MEHIHGRLPCPYIHGFYGLLTNYGQGGGGATKREGWGALEVLPLRKEGGGGGAKSLSHAEGGHKKFWCSLYAVARFSHIEGVGGGGGGGQNVYTHYKKKRGVQEVLPSLMGRGAQRFRPAIFPFGTPPPSP